MKITYDSNKNIKHLIFITLIVMAILPMVWPLQSGEPKSYTQNNKTLSESEIKTIISISSQYVIRRLLPGACLPKKLAD